MFMDAYGRRCADTREKTPPAAQRRPHPHVPQDGSHEVSNGILMRGELQRLFGQGYVTVTPDLRFRVNWQVRDQFRNGMIDCDLHDHRYAYPI
ncbi:MAG: HNH endonuclease [Vulcanimicrobiaceae bacterium]